MTRQHHTRFYTRADAALSDPPCFLASKYKVTRLDIEHLDRMKYIYVLMFVCTTFWASVYAYIQIHIYRYVYVQICVCVCVYVCVYIFWYMYICICIYIHIHDHRGGIRAYIRLSYIHINIYIYIPIHVSIEADIVRIRVLQTTPQKSFQRRCPVFI